MPFEAGLSRSWYNKGATAARSGRHRDMYSAWHSAKAKPRTMGTRITAQQSFYQGYIDNVGRHNPAKTKALKKLLHKVNPGRKLPAHVRIKKLPGGGFSVTPVEVNPGLFSKQRYKKVMHWGGHKGKIPKAWVQSREKYTRDQVKSIRRARKAARTNPRRRRGNIAW